MRRPGTRTLWLTCAVDGADHAVSDAAFLAAQGGDGRYEALCRATVWASSLAAPPAGRCPSCATAAGETAAVTPDRRTGGLWSRLVPRTSA
ncbi:hypothetical protein [Actinomycetospora chibensis]|jgi:hypothetical protein|uniref:Uncharacterized protein n=1 Tax=Actinomycetospora chibensis TaxID=663606 RepID=A0ABV9RFB4_9PSEU|nr:hypothetical protein [Actinomycetospora chibensis]MDD7925634.1 hypothetical protein [Actinomycetospora chibensis]